MYFAEFTNPKLYNSGNIKTVKLKPQNKKKKMPTKHYRMKETLNQPNKNSK